MADQNCSIGSDWHKMKKFIICLLIIGVYCLGCFGMLSLFHWYEGLRQTEFFKYLIRTNGMLLPFTLTNGVIWFVLGCLFGRKVKDNSLFIFIAFIFLVSSFTKNGQNASAAVGE